MPRLLLLLLLLGLFPARGMAQTCPNIVSQSPYITHTLQWLGLEQCIVGVGRYDHLQRPHTGGVRDPDFEAINTLAPELWLISHWTDLDQAELMAPERTRVIQVRGSRSMAQVEDNILTLARAAGLADASERARGFAGEWRRLASTVKGEGRRALIITGCSGTPYSFGENTWLKELFDAAGFQTVETREGSQAVKDLDQLIGDSEAELLFTFSRNGSQCPYINPKRAVRIIHLQGEQFLHPAPVLLEGLKALAEWSEKKT